MSIPTSSKEFKKITLLLRDSPTHIMYNQRLIEYLNDRHERLNSVGYAVAIEAIDNNNINQFVKEGIESIPALIYDSEIEYGVNNILALLAKLEISKAPRMSKESFEDKEEDDNAFQNMIMKEMMNTEQENENVSISKVKSKFADYAETPMSADMKTDKRLQEMDAIYKSRGKPPSASKVRQGTNTARQAAPPAKLKDDLKNNVDNLIKNQNYDPQEAEFFRNIAKNL